MRLLQYSAGKGLGRVEPTTVDRHIELASIGALFTASPRFVVNEMADSGHNLSVGLTADEYHRRVLSFVEECFGAEERNAQENTKAEAG